MVKKLRVIAEPKRPKLKPMAYLYTQIQGARNTLEHLKEVERLVDKLSGMLLRQDPSDVFVNSGSKDSLSFGWSKFPAKYLDDLKESLPKAFFFDNWKEINKGTEWENKEGASFEELGFKVRISVKGKSMAIYLLNISEL